MKRDSYEAVKHLTMGQLGQLLPRGKELRFVRKADAPKQIKRRAVNAYEDVAQLH